MHVIRPGRLSAAGAAAAAALAIGTLLLPACSGDGEETAPPVTEATGDLAAIVNGEPITVDDLDTRSYWWRQVPHDDNTGVDDDRALLDVMIDQVLWRQEVERRGLLGSEDDAVATIRQQQEAVGDWRTNEDMDSAVVHELYAEYEQRGMPFEDWDTNPEMIAAFQHTIGSTELTRALEREGTTRDALLAELHQDADIEILIDG